MFESTFAEMSAIRRGGTAMILIWSLVSGIGTGLPYIFVVAQALQRQLTIGDVALYAGLVFQIRRSLFVWVGNTRELQHIAFGAAVFFELLDYQDTSTVDRRVLQPKGSEGRLQDNVEPVGVGVTTLPAISLTAQSRLQRCRVAGERDRPARKDHHLWL